MTGQFPQEERREALCAVSLRVFKEKEKKK
jgi:hypothetical protein